MTVRQLEQSIDSYEIEEWCQFFKIRSDKKKPLTTGTLTDQLKSAFAGAKAKAQKAKKR